MDEIVREYAQFGAAVTGIMDAYKRLPEAKPETVIMMIEVAAATYGIEFKEE